MGGWGETAAADATETAPDAIAAEWWWRQGRPQGQLLGRSARSRAAWDRGSRFGSPHCGGHCAGTGRAGTGAARPHGEDCPEAVLLLPGLKCVTRESVCV